ncbi:MAG: ion channel [Pseudomonadota bacterium]
MTFAVTLGAGALIVCGFTHYLAMHWLYRWVLCCALGKALKSQLLLIALVLVHLVEAAVYTIAFALGARLGLGGFIQSEPVSAMSSYYFSLVNYTSLGLGDIYPSGHQRFIAGLESLNGFLLISCSAALLFLSATQANPKEASHAA